MKITIRSVALRIACLAVTAAALSGCIIYTNHADSHHRSAPVDEKPAETGSF